MAIKEGDRIKTSLVDPAGLQIEGVVTRILPYRFGDIWYIKSDTGAEYAIRSVASNVEVPDGD